MHLIYLGHKVDQSMGKLLVLFSWEGCQLTTRPEGVAIATPTLWDACRCRAWPSALKLLFTSGHCRSATDTAWP